MRLQAKKERSPFKPMEWEMTASCPPFATIETGSSKVVLAGAEQSKATCHPFTGMERLGELKRQVLWAGRVVTAILGRIVRFALRLRTVLGLFLAWFRAIEPPSCFPIVGFP